MVKLLNQMNLLALCFKEASFFSLLLKSLILNSLIFFAFKYTKLIGMDLQNSILLLFMLSTKAPLAALVPVIVYRMNNPLPAR